MDYTYIPMRVLKNDYLNITDLLAKISNYKSACHTST